MRLYLKHPEASPFLAHPKPGGSWQVVIIDNLGDGMTPPQIRQRIEEYQTLELTDQVEIWITSSNPVVVNEVQRAESANEIYCWFDGAWTMLSEVRDEDWLAHFTWGDLYERGHIG